MARGRDAAGRLSRAPARRPAVREFSAGGLVHRRRGGVVLLALAARRYGEGRLLRWSIPKGHLEPGEGMTDAAVREVREETGLVASIEASLGDVVYWYARDDEHGERVRVLKRVRFYLMRYEGGRFADRDHEMDAVRWFALDDAEATIGFANEREIVRRARRLLDDHAAPKR